MKKVIAILLVNILTVFRIVGVFFIVPVFLYHGGIKAALLSAFCYFTDMLDGILARRFKVSTFFGSIFDGIADKLFSLANLVVLLTITKFAIFPIFCECLILVITALKFQKNINIQSSKAGKLKTWVIALTVIILYFVSDINKLTFLSQRFIDFVNNSDKFALYGILFIPLSIFEVLTLISYLKFLKTYDPNQKVEIPEITLKLKNPKNFKDKWDNFCSIWLSNDFYVKYKDCAGLKEIRSFVKKNR